MYLIASSTRKRTSLSPSRKNGISLRPIIFVMVRSLTWKAAAICPFVTTTTPRAFSSSRLATERDTAPRLPAGRVLAGRKVLDMIALVRMREE